MRLGPAGFCHSLWVALVATLLVAWWVPELPAAEGRVATRVGRQAAKQLFAAASSGNARKLTNLLGADGAGKVPVDTRLGRGSTALMVAAKAGANAAVEALIAAGADLELRRRDDKTALALAALEGHGSTVSLLLEAGADPATRLRGGRLLLPSAIRSGDLATVSALLEASDLVTARGRGGQTALMFVEGPNNGPICRALVRAGADTTAVDADGWSVLHHLAFAGSCDCLQLLLDEGVPVSGSALQTVGSSPLKLAASVGASDCAAALAARCLSDAEHRCVVGEDTFRALTESGIEAVLRAFLESDSAAALRSDLGDSLLAVAVRAGQAEVAALLLERGADLDARDALGWSLLHNAAWAGHAEVVSSLISAGADLDARVAGDARAGGWRALDLAAAGGHTLVCARLLRAGAVRGRDSYTDSGRSPLHWAAWHGHQEVVSLLIQAGFDLDEPDSRGLTPKHLAILAGYPVVTGAAR